MGLGTNKIGHELVIVKARYYSVYFCICLKFLIINS